MSAMYQHALSDLRQLSVILQWRVPGVSGPKTPTTKQTSSATLFLYSPTVLYNIFTDDTKSQAAMQLHWDEFQVFWFSFNK